MILPMRFLVLILIVGAAGLLPFVMLRRPWALRVWQRVRLLFAIYALVILVSAVVALIFRWDAIYG
jgi:hypothetical protein